MAGFIVLSDGRAWAASNWAYDEAIRTIANALAQRADAAAFRSWLLTQTSEIQGMGLGRIDVRELTPKNQEVLLEAIRVAVAQCKSSGPEWGDPALSASWREYFEVLVSMIEAVERGEPPANLNPHMDDVLPPTGLKAGPGWHTQ